LFGFATILKDSIKGKRKK